MKTRGMHLGLVAFFLLVSLSGCTLDRIAAQQEKATGLWNELVTGETFGQSFVSTRDNLYQIDLSTATFDRVNSSPVIFHLRSGPEAIIDLFTITFPGPDIQNERPTSIRFPPLSDSGGRSYYFYVESPEGAPGDSITVYANAQDQYPAGTAYQNHQAVSGDLAFTAYSRETFSFSGVLEDFLSRVAQDVPFLVYYGILILGVCAGLLGSLYKSSHFLKKGE